MDVLQDMIYGGKEKKKAVLARQMQNVPRSSRGRCHPNGRTNGKQATARG